MRTCERSINIDATHHDENRVIFHTSCNSRDLVQASLNTIYKLPPLHASRANCRVNTPGTSVANSYNFDECIGAILATGVGILCLPRHVPLVAPPSATALHASKQSHASTYGIAIHKQGTSTGANGAPSGKHRDTHSQFARYTQNKREQQQWHDTMRLTGRATWSDKLFYLAHGRSNTAQ